MGLLPNFANDKKSQKLIFTFVIKKAINAFALIPANLVQMPKCKLLMSQTFVVLQYQTVKDLLVCINIYKLEFI